MDRRDDFAWLATGVSAELSGCSSQQVADSGTGTPLRTHRPRPPNLIPMLTCSTDCSTGNLVMYAEATRSYWSQILAEAICGPLKGECLDIVPSTVSTRGERRSEHRDTGVLLPPPHSKTVTE